MATSLNPEYKEFQEFHDRNVLLARHHSLFNQRSRSSSHNPQAKSPRRDLTYWPQTKPTYPFFLPQRLNNTSGYQFPRTNQSGIIFKHDLAPTSPLFLTSVDLRVSILIILTAIPQQASIRLILPAPSPRPLAFRTGSPTGERESAQVRKLPQNNDQMYSSGMREVPPF